MSFSQPAVQRLQAYGWPGNIRELRNVVERAMLMATANDVDEAAVELALPHAAGNAAVNGASGALADRVEEFERQTIQAELKRQRHHITNTAKALGLERSHLYKKCQQLGINLQSARSQI